MSALMRQLFDGLFHIRAQAQKRRPSVVIPLIWLLLGVFMFVILDPDERGNSEILWVLVLLIFAALEGFVYVQLRWRGEAAFTSWLPVARWTSFAALSFILIPILATALMKLVGIDFADCAFECTSDETGVGMLGLFLLGLVLSACAVLAATLAWIVYLMQLLTRGLRRSAARAPRSSQ